MKLRENSVKLWLGSAAILTSLLLAAPSVAAYNLNHLDEMSDPDKDKDKDNKDIKTPEPATLMLLAIGGGAAAVARYRRSRRNK